MTPWLCPLWWLACSGAGAQAAMERNTWLAFAGAGICLAITAMLAVDRFLYGHKDWSYYAAMILMAVHPAWSISATSGDCGYLKFDAACVFVVVFIGLAVRSAFRSRKHDPQ